MEARYLLLLSNLQNIKKVLRSGLCFVWLCGFVLIIVSLYGTQRLQDFLNEKNEMSKRGSHGLGQYEISITNITFFTAPGPFVGTTGKRQTLAVRSWLGLSENIDVVLFSKDPSVYAFAYSFHPRVSIETSIDFTFLGTPFFHSMVARSLASSSEVSVLIDPEAILLSNFITTLQYALRLDEDWVIVALSRNVSRFPFRLAADGKSWLEDDGKLVGVQKLQEYIARKQSTKPCGDRMLIAWNNGDLPLHKGVLPPFVYGEGFHNQWLISEALNSEFRLVVDASSTISCFHLDDLDEENSALRRSSSGSNFGKGAWEVVGNSLLGRSYGSFSFHGANYSNLFRFTVCGHNYLFVNTQQNIAYPMGHTRSLNLRNKGISLTLKQKDLLDCASMIKPLEGIHRCFSRELQSWHGSLSLPLPLEALLSMLADSNKTVILGVAGYSYKDLMMSWACRLWHLNLNNFIICGLDDEVYEFAILQGMPVIKCASPPTNISYDDCHFGTECFQKVTKVKSRMVLQILKLGYNVLLSDVDVYWFKNPLNYLTSFGPAVLVAQSDEYSTGPINKPRRLNSGFYYAHSDSKTIKALEKVVKHAATSNLSEQPSFYDTLCGEGGSNRLGDYRCLEPETELVVHFLDRDLFPNGAYLDLWAKNDTRKACEEKGSFIIHNNWARGRKLKLERQISSGLWDYDVNNRMCMQRWQKTKFTSYF